jgi:hypothetical protein
MICNFYDLLSFDQEGKISQQTISVATNNESCKSTVVVEKQSVFISSLTD